MLRIYSASSGTATLQEHGPVEDGPNAVAMRKSGTSAKFRLGHRLRGFTSLYQLPMDEMTEIIE